MKTTVRYSVLLLAWVLALGAFAQKRQELPTRYSKNKSAVITLTNGRQVKSPDTNIFMKDASLLYFQNGETKRARMDIIACVEFDDQKFINIENQLAYFIDSIKGNCLYCVEMIDMKAYKQGIINNRNFTYIDLSSERLETYADTYYDAEDFQYPVFCNYYYLLDGKFVRVHDRDLWIVLDKPRHRLFRTAISDPNFSWSDPKSLMKLLEMISQ